MLNKEIELFEPNIETKIRAPLIWEPTEQKNQRDGAVIERQGGDGGLLQQ